MIRFGMPTLIENRTLQDNISLCSRLGLSFIELNMNFPEYQTEELEKTGYLLEAADAAGVYYTIHLDENLNIADFNRLVTDTYLETVRRTIEVTKNLLSLRDSYDDAGQPLTINMHMHHGIYITLPDRKVQMYERDIDRYLTSCRRFRDLCDTWIGDAPITIAVENTDGFRSYEQKAIELFLESPCFGLTWDIGHSKAVGEKDVPFIRAHENRLVHFHIHDGTEQPPSNHLALGDGEINLAERLRTAQAHHCRCVLETKTAEALERSVRFLREQGLGG